MDVDRISQVLINVLGNALQYTPEKGRVSLDTQRSRSEIEVSVEDTGDWNPGGAFASSVYPLLQSR